MELLFRVTHLPFGFLVAVQEVRCPILCLKPLPGPLTQLRAWMGWADPGRLQRAARREAAGNSLWCQSQDKGITTPAPTEVWQLFLHLACCQLPQNTKHGRKPQHNPHKGRS